MMYDPHSGRGVAQPGSAPALGQRTPIPTAPFRCTDFHCFQQLGESAFRSERSASVSTTGGLRQFCDRAKKDSLTADSTRVSLGQTGATDQTSNWRLGSRSAAV